MKRGKKLAAAALALALTVSLAGCVRAGDDGITAEEAAALVRGNLDLLYRGTYETEYLEEVNCTEEDAKASYDNNMEVEANYLLYYYRAATYGHSTGNSYTFMTDEQRETAISLCRDIYGKIRYTVGDAKALEDGSFEVAVTYAPLDLHEQVNQGWVEFEKNFVSQYDDVEKGWMDDAEYDKWLEETVFPAYNQAVLDLVRGKLETAGYGPEATATLKVAKDSDGYYVIDYASFDAFDRLLVPVSKEEEPTPSAAPSGEPSTEPSGEPTTEPSGEPTTEPSGEPTTEPSGEPTTEPSGEPTTEPSAEPTE